MRMPQAELSDTEVVVSVFGFPKPEQWQRLRGRLKSPEMLVASANQAIIYLTPGALTTKQVVRILTESGFEVSHAGEPRL
jgi:hypothetical protein